MKIILCLFKHKWSMCNPPIMEYKAAAPNLYFAQSGIMFMRDFIICMRECSRCNKREIKVV